MARPTPTAREGLREELSIERGASIHIECEIDAQETREDNPATQFRPGLNRLDSPDCRVKKYRMASQRVMGSPFGVDTSGPIGDFSMSYTYLYSGVIVNFGLNGRVSSVSR